MKKWFEVTRREEFRVYFQYFIKAETKEEAIELAQTKSEEELVREGIGLSYGQSGNSDDEEWFAEEKTEHLESLDKELQEELEELK